MKNTEYEIVIQEIHYRELRYHLLGDSPVENAAYLLCGRSDGDGRTKLLVRDVIKLRGEDFYIQSEDRLQISTEAVARVMKLARLGGLSIVLAHSHPLCEGEVDFSWADDSGDAESFPNFYQRVPEGPHASLVFGQRAVRGRVWLPGSEQRPLAGITVVGRRQDKIAADGRPPAGAAGGRETHDRQIRAFGLLGQERIAETSVAVVGAGGTGSAVADQLIRLGVRRLVVIDGDVVEESNVSRIYNSTLDDAASKTPKVDVVDRLGRSVGLGTEIRAIKGDITEEEFALELRRADVIFCCTDNQWSRAILNQYAYQYLTPVIDLGNKIDGTDGLISAANGRVYLIVPGSPCLWCYGVLDGMRVAEESLPAEERESLAREGYVTGADTAAPSVVFLNTVVAGLAVGEFVNLVTGYMGRDFHPQLTYYALTGEVKPTVYEADPLCACATGKHTAFGDLLKLPCRLPQLVAS
jgi:molybdopterin/thiamine biosynthesis adenylyltransferase